MIIYNKVSKYEKFLCVSNGNKSFTLTIRHDLIFVKLEASMTFIIFWDILMVEENFLSPKNETKRGYE